MSNLEFVVPGQTLAVDSGFLKGHGTYVETSEEVSIFADPSSAVPEGYDNMQIEAAPSGDDEGAGDGPTSSAPSSGASAGPSTEPSHEPSQQPAKKRRLVASVAGAVSRVNMLISVIPLQAMYAGEVGDLVVGRISAVESKRWKVDMGAAREANLMLSSVNLPGGAQRIRTYEDQLQMRSLFVEEDLVSAEVQQLMGDGAASLHTRSLR